MLKRQIIREEHPETGNLYKQTTRYDGEWHGIIKDQTTILIMIGEEELVNTVISIPTGKILHMRINIAGIQVDVPTKGIK